MRRIILGNGSCSIFGRIDRGLQFQWKRGKGGRVRYRYGISRALVGWLVGEGETVKTLPLEFNSQYLEKKIMAYFFLFFYFSFLRESLIKG